MSLSIKALPVLLLVLAGRADAQPAQQPLPVLDVPFISQSEALCGGAAAAMVLRYWGERGLSAESFAHLVDTSAAGIRTSALVDELTARGWNATGIEGTADLVARELADGRPVLTLIEDRPGTFHYIVIVARTPRAIVFHDPARAPFRVMNHDEFGRRWDAADRWMAVVVPGGRSGEARVEAPTAPAAVPAAAEGADGAAGEAPCDRLVREGVGLAQANDLDAAERALGAALTCPGGAASRELAGVRLLQRRWPEVSELASAAVAEDPEDAHAWRLLATSRFVQNDRAGALDAWNRAGEPRLDLMVVTGLHRTRPRVVEELIGVAAGDVLTTERFARADRLLAELPSAATARLDYVPVPGGLAELRVSLLERPLVPTGWWSYVAIGLEATARREVGLTLGAPAGGGERVDLAWRFWPNRPRLSGGVAAPAPWGGVWEVSLSSERQPFDSGLPPADRLSARAGIANWLTSGLRLGVRGGTDRWTDLGSFGHAATELRVASRAHAIDATVDLSLWAGPTVFSSASFGARVQSSRARRGRVYLARAGAALTTARTPADLWFGGDTGHARPVLLRAHPLLDDGALRIDRLGRRAVHATGEAQQWWSGPAGLGAAAAVFLDAAHVGRRLGGGAIGDVDAGVGARFALPGLAGLFRVDVARGLRDGATAVSFAYEP